MVVTLQSLFRSDKESPLNTSYENSLWNGPFLSTFHLQAEGRLKQSIAFVSGCGNILRHLIRMWASCSNNLKLSNWDLKTLRICWCLNQPCSGSKEPHVFPIFSFTCRGTESNINQQKSTYKYLYAWHEKEHGIWRTYREVKPHFPCWIAATLQLLLRKKDQLPARVHHVPA